MSALTALEKEVIDLLLHENVAYLSALQEQVSELFVEERQRTGAGFYTVFNHAVPKPLAGHESLELVGVGGTAPSVARGVGFILFIVDGLISGLEGFAYEEDWPNDEQQISVFPVAVARNH